MTREQTIEKLKALYTNAVAAMLRADACDDDESAKVMTEYAETLNAAINALETTLQTDGDCISRQAAIEAVLDMNTEHCVSWLDAVVDTLDALPSVQPEEHTEERTETHACDCISRQSAIDAIISKLDAIDHVPQWVFDELTGVIGELPSVQQEPLSDAYMKAIWTWLLNYQIKVAELKGRYTPYEVLSWVANDWRKEHEGLD